MKTHRTIPTLFALLFILFLNSFLFSQTINLPGQTIGTLANITISYSGASGVGGSWIGLYRVGDGDLNYLSYQYINESQSGTLTFTGLEETGHFNFRLFSGNGYDKIATSENFLNKQGALIDPAFGIGGIFRKDFLLNNLDDWAVAGRVTDDDKIIVAGTAKTGLFDSDGYELNEFTLVRFNANGELDNSFGNNGVKHTSFTTISAKEVRALVVQDNGKIIVGGIGVIQGVHRMYAVMLVGFDVDGNIDNSFGVNGVVITNFRYASEPENFSDDDLRCMELQPDGKIFVGGGSILNQPYFPGRPFIARYNQDGSLDNTFGASGFITPQDSIGFRGYVESIIPPTEGGDGSFFSAVIDYAQFGMNSHLVYKMQSDGNFETTFGNGGIIEENRPGYHNGQFIRSIGIAPDGTLIMMGGSDVFAFWLMQRNAGDGSFYNSFGSEGLFYCDPTYLGDTPGGMLFTESEILIGTSTLNNRWSTSKLTLDGDMVLNYGVPFYSVMDGGNIVQSSVNSICRQSDGKIILIGGSKFPGTNNWDFMVLRFYENPEIYTNVEGEQKFPNIFSLEQNYPNPFNPSTKISWQSPIGSWQTLKVYDVLGNEVATLVNGYKPAGIYNVEFTIDNLQLSSGVYFYQFKAGNYLETKKMILIK